MSSSISQSATTTVIINLAPNEGLDAQGAAPMGRVIGGLDVARSLYSGYHDDPQEGEIYRLGNDYLISNFPNLDYVVTTSITEL